MDFVKVLTKECEYVGWSRGMRGEKGGGYYLVLGTGATPRSTDGHSDVNIPADAIVDVQVFQGSSVITKTQDIDYYLVSLPTL